jgi:hypothetical protein
MKQQWQPPTAIEVMILQIEDGIALALADAVPKTEPVIIRMAYNNIAKTEHFKLCVNSGSTQMILQKQGPCSRPVCHYGCIITFTKHVITINPHAPS